MIDVVSDFVSVVCGFFSWALYSFLRFFLDVISFDPFDSIFESYVPSGAVWDYALQWINWFIPFATMANMTMAFVFTLAVSWVAYIIVHQVVSNGASTAVEAVDAVTPL